MKKIRKIINKLLAKISATSAPARETPSELKEETAGIIPTDIKNNPQSKRLQREHFYIKRSDNKYKFLDYSDMINSVQSNREEYEIHKLITGLQQHPTITSIHMATMTDYLN
jgi:hypothetical protein